MFEYTSVFENEPWTFSKNDWFDVGLCTRLCPLGVHFGKCLCPLNAGLSSRLNAKGDVRKCCRYDSGHFSFICFLHETLPVQAAECMHGATSFNKCCLLGSFMSLCANTLLVFARNRFVSKLQNKDIISFLIDSKVQSRGGKYNQ